MTKIQNSFREIIFLIGTVFVSIIIAFFVGSVSAQQMSSGSYKIQSDSVNFGGVRSTSTTYLIEDTMGEIATGDSQSSSYKMHAGYQQMSEVYLSVVPPTPIIMPTLGGLTGGMVSSSTSFTVTTDGMAGYYATLQSSSSPAMVSGIYSISDYAPSGANPDFTWTVAATSSAFGFTVSGSDTAIGFKDNSSVCGIGSFDSANTCWRGLSTSPISINNRTSANHPSGTVTTIEFRTELGSSHLQPSGTYVATSTLTVIPM